MAKVDQYGRWIFGILLLWMVLDRAYMVWITMPYASDDLTVIWLATSDYAQGIFHEPFFYGQDYGVMLEAMLATPMVMLGGDPVRVIPIMIGLLAIAPFAAFAIHYHRRGDQLAAILFITMPLLLPVQHGLQTTALNGIAIIACYPWLARIGSTPLRSVLVALVLGIAVFVNPNALVVALPLGLYDLFTCKERVRTLVGHTIGLVIVFGIWFACRSFYAERPEGIVNTIFDWRLHFKPYMIPQAMEVANHHFAWMCPLTATRSSVVLLLLVFAAMILFAQRNFQVAIPVCCALLLILFSFSFAKLHDGSDSIFFPLSRMFIGVPLLLAWALAHVHTSADLRRGLIVGISTLVLANGIIRISTAQDTFELELADQEGLPLRTRPIQHIRTACGTVAEVAAHIDCDNIILLRGNDPFTAQFLAYATPVLIPASPRTWMVGHDRRAFQRIGLVSLPAGHCLVVGGTTEEWNRWMEQDPTITDHSTSSFIMHAVDGHNRSIAEMMGLFGASS